MRGRDFYYDLPGNHDAYSDRYYDYYRANSVQGRAGKGPQLSWTYEQGGRTYHFLGVNSAGNDGAGVQPVVPVTGTTPGSTRPNWHSSNQELSPHVRMPH